jgi:hypothetical protein
MFFQSVFAELIQNVYSFIALVDALFFRSDKGYENADVAIFMLQQRGSGRASHITGKSVHNTRIERLWRDVFDQCSGPFYRLFWLAIVRYFKAFLLCSSHYHNLCVCFKSFHGYFKLRQCLAVAAFSYLSSECQEFSLYELTPLLTLLIACLHVLVVGVVGQ